MIQAPAGAIDTNLPPGVTQAQAPQTNIGLVNQAMTTAPPVVATPTSGKVAQVDPTQFDPSKAKTASTAASTNTTAAQTTGTNWNVNPNQTVAGQLNGLIDSNSPFIQAARARAADTSNARGLLNTTMGVQAGESAAINAALPIAQADANTNAAAGQYNAGVANQTGQFNTSAQNQANSQNAQQATQTSQFNTGQTNALQSQLTSQNQQVQTSNMNAQNDALKTDAASSLQASMSNADNAVKQSAQKYDAATKVALANTDAAGKVQLQQIDAQTRNTLMNIEAQYHVQMQTSQSMAASYGDLVNNISKVMADPSLDGPGKQANIGNLTNLFNNTMQIQQNLTGLNLGALLDPTQFGGNATATPAASNVAPAPAPMMQPQPYGAVNGDVPNYGY